MNFESPRYDWLRRAVRTFLQAFIGMIVLIGFPIAQNIINAATNGDPVQFDVDAWKRVLIAALLAGGVALVSAIQNALEDKAGVPAVLKGQAQSGQNPVPDPMTTPDQWPEPALSRDPDQWPDPPLPEPITNTRRDGSTV